MIQIENAALNDFVNRIRNSAKRYLAEADEYPQDDRHRSFARNVGVCLCDFGSEGWDYINSTYSSIYVIACNLKPRLDADEWLELVRDGWKSEGARRDMQHIRAIANTDEFKEKYIKSYNKRREAFLNGKKQKK